MENDEFLRGSLFVGSFKHTFIVIKGRYWIFSPFFNVGNIQLKIDVLKHKDKLWCQLTCNQESNSNNLTCSVVGIVRVINHDNNGYLVEDRFRIQKGGRSTQFQLPDRSNLIVNRSFTIEVDIFVELDNNIGLCLDLGLKEQNHACYVNSLLQILYFTNSFRRAVYQVSNTSKDLEKFGTLRDFFGQLQDKTNSVDANELMRSFGWKAKEFFYKRDPQNFLNEFFSEMKGSSLERTVYELFQVKKVSHASCKHVNFFQAQRKSVFDIKLNISGKTNIDESFKDYLGWYGSQDAEKQEFLALPPVLHLHLSRFSYDSSNNVKEKFNDCFEFGERINLDEFVQKPDPKNTENYTLHAVLVQRDGDNPWNGHYVVYLNPNGDGSWLRFQDDVVSHCQKEVAIQNNYGGACMLVYIRDSELNNVLRRISDTEIPRKSQDYMTVKVFLEDSFKDHQGYDLYDPKMAPYTLLHIRKEETGLIQILVDTFECAAEKLRPWSFYTRSDQSFRLSYLDLQGKTVAEAAKNQNPWHIFLEVSPPNETALPAFDKIGDILLFLKMYDPKEEKIHYCGHCYMSITSRVNELIPVLNSRAGFPEDTELFLYEENGGYIMKEINDHSEELAKVLWQISDGTILIFEKKERVHSDMPTCVDYFRNMNNRFELTLINKSIPNDAGIIMEVSPNITYLELAWEVARKNDIEPYSLLFFNSQRHEDLINSCFDGCLRDFSFNLKSDIPKKIFYKQLGGNMGKMNKKGVTCIYLSSALEEEKTFFLHFNEIDTIADLLDVVKKYIKYTEGTTGKLRLMELNCDKVTMGPKDVTPLENVVNNMIWRIDDIKEMEEDQLLICCIRFHKKMFSTFDTPFLIKLVQGEPFSRVKERIRKKMFVAEAEWRTFIFAIVSMGEANFIVEKEYTVNFADFNLPNDSSRTFDYFIAVTVTPSGKDVHGDENVFSSLSLKEQERDFDETESKPVETTTMQKQIVELQRENSMLRTKISVMDRDIKTKDSLIMGLREEKPRNTDSPPNSNVNEEPYIGRMGIPRNYRL